MRSRMSCVPADSVYSRCSVRSTRRPRSANADNATSAMNTRASSGNAKAGKLRRLKMDEKRDMAASVGFLEVDHQHRGEQPGGDAEQEVGHVAQIEHAAGDGLEMREETQTTDRIDNPLRRERTHHVQGQREASE